MRETKTKEQIRAIKAIQKRAKKRTVNNSAMQTDCIIENGFLYVTDGERILSMETGLYNGQYEIVILSNTEIMVTDSTKKLPQIIKYSSEAKFMQCEDVKECNLTDIPILYYLQVGHGSIDYKHLFDISKVSHTKIEYVEMKGSDAHKPIEIRHNKMWWLIMPIRFDR